MRKANADLGLDKFHLIGAKVCGWVLIFVCVCLANGCRPKPDSQGKIRTFDGKGIVVQQPVGNTVVIQHEAIPSYMGAMTMPFEAKESNELRGLQAGDIVSFRLNVTATNGWIDKITKLNTARQPIPTNETVHVSPAVDSLSEGDLVPDFHFTNELGQAVDLRQFRGQTTAFTFFFISCPFPNFCPRMTANFAEVAGEIKSGTNSSWHLFSVSFDTDKDTPARLLDYAKAHHYEAEHWSFLTGDPKEISRFAELFDERYWNEGQSIGHNLRTVVIDPAGRVKKIFEGNQWTSEELVTAMRR